MKSGTRQPYFAAVTMISTRYCGPARRDSTVARAGALPLATQPSHTLFISSKVRMSDSQILAFRIFALLLPARSEEHTSELQSLMRISYAVFCLKKKNKNMTLTN